MRALENNEWIDDEIAFNLSDYAYPSEFQKHFIPVQNAKIKRRPIGFKKEAAPEFQIKKKIGFK